MKNNKKIIAAIIAVLIVVALVVIVLVNNNKPVSNVVDSTSKSEVSSSDDVVSNSSKDETSESIVIGTAPDAEDNENSGNSNVIDFPDDSKSSSSEEVTEDSTSKEETSKSESTTSKEETSESKTETSTSKEETSSSKEESSSKPENSTSKEETSSSNEDVTIPSEDENSSSTPEVIVPPIEDDEPTIPSTPSGDSNWDGDYDNLPTDGFDHIKVPTRDDFNDKGFNESTKDSAFDFDSDWSDEWYDAYQDFLVANGSPIGSDGKPMGAFNAIHDGNIDGYQYLYYGINWDGSNNGWGDIILYNSGMYHGWEGSKAKYEDFKDAYFFELDGFTYGKMDKGVENEYRAASTMMLSWICSNPSQVEKVIYDGIIDDGNSILVNHINKYGYTWMQVGEVDIAVLYVNNSEEAFQFAIRKHDDSKSMIYSR